MTDATTAADTKDTVTFLDLDAIVAERKVVVQYGGAAHELKELTVEDFIANVSDQQKLAGAGSVGEEVNLVIKMLVRAFPTLSEESLRAMSLARLYKLLSFALESNGSTKAADEVKAKEGAETENPPTAG